MIQRVYTAGIEVRESGHPKIQRNKIYGHESSGGVYVHHYGRAGHLLQGVVSVHARAFSVRSAYAHCSVDAHLNTKTRALLYSPPLCLASCSSRTFSANETQIWRRTTSTTTPCQASHVGNLESQSVGTIGFPPGLFLFVSSSLGHYVVAY